MTGESRKMSDVEYIGNACKIAKKYFKVVGVEVYPMNSDEYAHLHKCGADFVTVFQETYNSDKYETLHLEGHKRIFPYRFYAQERAILGGMRGWDLRHFLGLDDFRKTLSQPVCTHICCRRNIRMRKLRFRVRV